MGLFDTLTKAAKFIVDDLNTPESFKKGEKFEAFTREVIFPQAKYKLLKQTHNYSQNSKDYVEESLEPDFLFECKETGRQFYVEAKFRSDTYDGSIQFSYKAQFERYKEIGKTNTVFVIIGIGDNPSKPEHVCLMPLDDIGNISLTESFLEKYTIANNRAVAISKLESLLDTGKTVKPKAAAPAPVKNKPVENEKAKAKNTAYCIRCKTSLPYNPDKPLCKTCYAEWAEYENEDYEEDYCHYCGKEKDVSFAKPVCYSCYKQLSRE